MIIQAPGISSLAQYIKDEDRLHEGQPDLCFHCKTVGQLRGHGYYTRRVKEGDVVKRIRIHRLLCTACSKTFSCLFQFLVPWKRYTAQTIAVAIQAYLTKPSSSCRKVAGTLTSLAPGASSLSHSTVSRWVKAFCDKSQKKILSQIQGLCVASGIDASLLAVVEAKLANRQEILSLKAPTKSRQCGILAVVLAMLLARSRSGALQMLHEILLRQFLPESIFGGHGVRLLNPQSLEHLIF
jgi:hypothetical protein